MFIPEQVRPFITDSANKIKDSFFFYDIDGFKKKLKSMDTFDGLKLWYACKANPLSSIIKGLEENHFRFDCASLGEIDQVLSQNIAASNILTTGPAKSKEFFFQALERGLRTFIIESLNQLTWLNEVSTELKLKPDVLLRVQLSWDEGEEDILGGNEISAFGLPPEQWNQIQIKDYPSLNFQGIHIFQWGNVLDIHRLEKIWSMSASAAKELTASLGFELQVMDLGGGLGIPYTNDEQELPWSVVVESLKRIRENFSIPEVWMELGRYLIGPHGFYITEVCDIKTIREKNLLILKGGINHLIRPSLTGQAFPTECLNQREGALTDFTLHGPLCTALDKLGTISLPSDIQVGDKIVFSQSGAYGFTESMPFFLCHEFAAEVILDQSQVQVIRETQKPHSWLK